MTLWPLIFILFILVVYVVGYEIFNYCSRQAKNKMYDRSNELDT
jgi:hypothetical protein